MKYELINDIIKIKISSLPFFDNRGVFGILYSVKKMKHLLFQNHWIFMDGTRIGRQSRLVGEYLEIKIYPNWSSCISQQQVKCEVEIVYEDAFLVIVYKPSGLIVHDDDSSRKNLQKILNDYYFQKGTGIAVQALHRLDRETTGLVAFSKSPVFQPLFDKMIAEKRIQRNYLAIVDRVVPKKKKYTFTDRIGQNRHDSAKRVITKSGIEAKTVAVSLGTYLNLSLLKCTLYTGRTHQIRLHLSFHGMPIINDCLYGQKSKFIEEMGLFGYELVFIHPITEIPIQLQCNFDCLLKEKNGVVSLIAYENGGLYGNEKTIYNTIHGSIMCELVKCYDKYNCLVLLNCGNEIADWTIAKEKVKSFFKTVYSHRIICSPSNSFHSYEEILMGKLENLDKVQPQVAQYVKNAINIYNRTLINSKQYIIHGDMHRHNLLELNNVIKAIDPIGYVAPFEIEYARYIGTELEMIIDSDVESEINSRLKEMLEFFSEFSPSIGVALYIDVVFRMHNATFECDDDVLVNRWLKVLAYIESEGVLG